jgi:hypothetical protein
LPIFLWFSACSGTDAIEGDAWQWLDPPPHSHSFILVDSNDFPRQPIRMQELPEVAITLRESRSRTAADASSPGARATTTSGAHGRFLLSTTNAPFVSDLVLGAQHSECEAARKVFRHRSFFPHHSVTVVLVCPGLPGSDFGPLKRGIEFPAGVPPRLPPDGSRNGRTPPQR